MYELKTNTAVRIPVGPLVDPTDGKTAKTGLTVTGMSVEIFQMKNDGSAVVRAAFAPTASGGDNDMVHVTDDTTGMYDLELTAAQLNWLGNGRIAFYDVDGFLVHWIDIQVVSANFFGWKYGTGNVNANAVLVNGESPEDSVDIAAVLLAGMNSTPPKVDIETIKTQAVTCAAGVTVLASVGTAATSTAQTGDSFAIVNGDHGLVSIQDDLDEVLIDTGTTLDTLVKDIPTTTEFELRTLPAADYVVVTDTIAGVTTATNLTNLPAISADWLTAAGVKADAVTKIQNGLATPTNITAGTITTVTNLTNAPTNGDLTAAMKASVTSSVPTAAAIAIATRDVDNTSPAADSLGEAINNTSSAGSGATTWTYTITNSGTGLPIADVDVWVTTDSAGTNIIASSKTNQSGVATFYLDTGTVYVWRQKTGWNFTNPDMEVVS
jgi:hypothetical protein